MIRKTSNAIFDLLSYSYHQMFWQYVSVVAAASFPPSKAATRAIASGTSAAMPPFFDVAKALL